jgi:peptidoglycan/xylan/chitin deacetylase (PgdA/CDA1 family)
MTSPVDHVGSLVGRLPGRYGLVSLLGPNGLRVVVYHDVSSSPGPCIESLGVAVSPEIWVKHLDYYEHEYAIVDLETVLNGRLPKRALLITFDDGYRSVLDTVAPELTRRGLPAVLFPVVGTLGNRRLMLDNLLSYLANTVGLERLETAVTGRPPTHRSLPAILDRAVAPLPYSERLALGGRLVDELGVDEDALLARYRLYLEPGDVSRLAELGFEIGCHTASHVHCRCLGADDARHEIVDAAATLVKLAGRPVRAFSYPYGSGVDATPVAQEALRASGQEIAFLVEARANEAGRLGRHVYRVAMDWPGPGAPFERLEVFPRLRNLGRRKPRVEPRHE